MSKKNAAAAADLPDSDVTNFRPSDLQLPDISVTPAIAAGLDGRPCLVMKVPLHELVDAIAKAKADQPDVMDHLKFDRNSLADFDPSQAGDAYPTPPSDAKWAAQEREYFAVLDLMREGTPLKDIMRETDCTRNVVGLLGKVLKHARAAAPKNIGGCDYRNEADYAMAVRPTTELLDQRHVHEVAERIHRWRRGENGVAAAARGHHIDAVAAAMIHLRKWARERHRNYRFDTVPFKRRPDELKEMVRQGFTDYEVDFDFVRGDDELWNGLLDGMAAGFHESVTRDDVEGAVLRFIRDREQKKQRKKGKQ